MAIATKAIPAVAALMGALFAGEGDAEAMPRPQYMIDLINQLKNRSFESMDFGRLNGKQLRKAQQIDPSFTEGPVKLSAKNIEKFANKRIGSDGLTEQEFVDGLNSSLFNTRNHAFPNKGGAKFYLPGEDYTWTGVIAPHDGFSGLVTGYKLPNEGAKKELQSLSEGRPFPSGHSPDGGSARPGRLTAVESEPKLPVENNVTTGSGGVKKIPLALLASSGLLSADTPEAAYMAVTGRAPSEGVEEAWWSPVDLAVAPVGAVGIPAKLISTALDAPLTIGTNAALSRLFGNQ